jgi:hypothetical protein
LELDPIQKKKTRGVGRSALDTGGSEKVFRKERRKKLLVVLAGCVWESVARHRVQQYT